MPVPKYTSARFRGVVDDIKSNKLTIAEAVDKLGFGGKGKDREMLLALNEAISLYKGGLLRKSTSVTKKKKK